MGNGVFISYSHHDKEIAEYIKEQLEACGIDVFIDYERLIPSNSFYDQIRDEIDARDNFLLLASSNSLKSRWVNKEVKWADHKDKRIIPIILEEVDLSPFWFLIDIQHIDFKRWYVDRKVENSISKLRSTLDLKLIGSVGKVTAELPPSMTKIESSENLIAKSPILQYFPKVRKIIVLKHITQGNSGSKVFFVQAILRADPAGLQSCFLKIHYAQGETPLERHQKAYETFSAYMPEVLDATPWDSSNSQIALLYKIGQSAEHFRSLDHLLQSRAATAKSVIQAVCNALGQWNSPTGNHTDYRSSTPYELLTQAISHSEDVDVGYRRLHDREASIFARVNREFYLTAEKPQVRFEGVGFDRRSIWPNPLAYLASPELWAEAGNTFLPWLCGHIHGDMNARNILALENKDDRPIIIDFDTYDPANLIFIDFCQLELGIILSLCSPSDPDNQRELVALSEYLANNLELAPLPDLGIRSVGINEILRPIRLKLAEFWRYGSELIASYLIARIAVGLEMSRKTKARREERVFAFLFAADSLARLLKYFQMESPSCDRPTIIKWIKDEIPNGEAV